MVEHFFPLLSLCVLFAIIATPGGGASASSAFYASIATMNSILLIVLLNTNTDFVIWFILFEVSIVTGISALVVEGRSYRRIFALSAMLLVTFVGSICTYSAINSTAATSFSTNIGSLNQNHGIVSSWIGFLLVCIVILGKIPLFPFSFWLPEAHVEASWPGSVVLAGFALKFATIAVCLFLFSTFQAKNGSTATEVFAVVGVVSTLVGTVATASTADCKKLVANLSIVHMSVSFLLLTSSFSGAIDAINFGWHHHSAVTGFNFLLIGIAYAQSGSRLIRLVVQAPQAVVVLCTILFVIATFSLDMPWTSNVVIEIAFIGLFILKFFPSIPAMLCVVFWISIIGICIICNPKASTVSANSGGSTSQSVTSSSDFQSWWNLATISAIGVVLVGFFAYIFQHIGCNLLKVWALRAGASRLWTRLH